jgi:beta-lactamase regulating signal transducer with metallopeptidase domain
MNGLIRGGASWALEASLYAGVLAILVLLVQWVMGERLSARWRYGMGLLVLARLCLPVAPGSHLSISNLLPASAAESRAAQAGVPVERAEALGSTLAWQAGGGAAGGGSPALELPLTDTLSLTDAPNGAVPAGDRGSAVRALLPAIWLAGVAAFLSSALLSHWRLRRWLARAACPASPATEAIFLRSLKGWGTPARVRLLEVPGLHTVALVGSLRPRLIVPEGLSDLLSADEIGHIFAHELAHLRKGDLFVNWLVVLAAALHWFNPFARIGLRRLLADREVLRDEDATRGASAEARLLYGETLIKILETFQPARLSPGAAPIFNTKPEIRRRITMIAKPKQTSSRLLTACCLILSAGLGMATFTTAVRAAADDEKNEGKQERSQSDEKRDKEKREGDREHGEAREKREGDREHGEAREKREGDREHGEAREKREGDREHGEAREKREGDREHGEAREKREGDREHGEAREKREGDREHGEAREKREGDREHGEAREKREGDREHGEAREKREGDRPRPREGDEARAHLEELERALHLAEQHGHETAAAELRGHLAARRRAIANAREREGDRPRPDAREGGGDRAAMLERRLAEMAGQMERMQRAMEEMRAELRKVVPKSPQGR